ncbi:uncharacterized protein LOC128472338 [Spea bombifrons]|uniref:uncharacterized protein LOC128472338 n=1 Tax=Spea bombifrons TaxID=233779 RepID=UPI00234A1852|nr:uncharacterized protein LOC128472338 [Spea bombifrons]
MADTASGSNAPPADIQAWIQVAIKEALANLTPALPASTIPQVSSQPSGSDSESSAGSPPPKRPWKGSSAHANKGKGPAKRAKRRADHASAGPSTLANPSGDAPDYTPPSGDARDYSSDEDSNFQLTQELGSGEPLTSSEAALQCADPSEADLVYTPQGETLFDPRFIRHPRSAEWTPPDHIARYLQVWMRKALDKEVRNKLRAECPRPTIPGKVTATPEFDSFMVTYMNKKGRDPRRGLEKGLKSAQDKLLDVSGPMTQIFVLADEATAQNSPLDPGLIKDWVQRGLCLLGNANAAISAERRKAALLRIDPRLADMADKELGPKADGKLFGDPFISELRKHAGNYTTINKVETSLKKVFQAQGVFHRAGRQRGRAASRGTFTGPRYSYSPVSTPQYNPTFRTPFPASRGFQRGRGRGGRGRTRFSSA